MNYAEFRSDIPMSFNKLVIKGGNGCAFEFSKLYSNAWVEDHLTFTITSGNPITLVDSSPGIGLRLLIRANCPNAVTFIGWYYDG